MVTDYAAFPRGNTALSLDLAFYCPWSAFRTPETCPFVCIATSARFIEWGGDLHGPRMIFLEKIGTFFVPYSRRGPAFDLLLSISLGIILSRRLR